jgi:predicted GIY-YIG superfamily endonuclease
MIGVYEIKNTVTGDFYIGSSVDILNRWREHMRELDKQTHTAKRLQAAWIEYGRPAFAFTILQETTKEERLTVEYALIASRKPAYNEQPGDRPAREKQEPHAVAEGKYRHYDVAITDGGIMGISARCPDTMKLGPRYAIQAAGVHTRGEALLWLGTASQATIDELLKEAAKLAGLIA